MASLLTAASLCPSINGFFVRSLRYAQKIILGISNICLWLFFFECLDLKRKSSFMDGHKSGPILAKNRIYLQTEGAPFAIHLVTIYHSHLKTIQITFGSLNASNQSYNIEKALFFKTVIDMIGCSHRYFFDSSWVITTIQCMSIVFFSTCIMLILCFTISLCSEKS